MPLFKPAPPLRTLYYELLPLFFAASIAIAWFKHPQGGPDFVEAIKRAVVATLLLVGFTEITDVILFLADGLSRKIDDMSGIDAFYKMASQKARGYTLSPTSVVLAFNDLLVATLAFLSYIVVYAARFIMVAIYHFTWIFLLIIAPILLLFHLFSPRLTLCLFRSMIEVASWKIVWSVLSAMLAALPFGNAYVADGNYLTVIVLNLVIALCMIGTPLVVHALVGSGLSAMTGALGPAVLASTLAVPAKAAVVTRVGRGVLTDTTGFVSYHGRKLAARARLSPQNPSDQSRTPESTSRPGNSSAIKPPTSSDTPRNTSKT